MVKRGGLKRKIAIEKIEKKTSRAPCYSKRCNGLFGKAAQLCLLSGAQIAVLATPMSDNSNVSFFSFGHASVDGIVSAFLSGKRPPFPSSDNMREDIAVCLTQKSLGLGFWWEDKTLTTSQNPQELSHAVDSMRNLLKDAKQLRLKDDKQLRSVDHHHHIHGEDIQNKETKKSDQTLITPAIGCLSYDLPLDNLDQTLTTPAIGGFSDDLLHNTDTQIMPYSQDFYITDNNSNSYALSAENLDPAVGCFSDDFLQNTNTQMMANSEDFSIMDNNIALQAENFDDLDIMELIDFDSTSESLLPSDEILKPTFESLQSDGVFESTLELQEFAASLLTTSDSHDSMDLTMFSHSQPVQDGDLMLQNRGLIDDYLHFSDVFNLLLISNL